MTPDRKLLQHALRSRRTRLFKAGTLLPSSSSRRGGFSAAMQQFEELMTASAAVGPASRPITLYYATVQAGHAVAAARKADPWSFSRHGLKLQNNRTSIADIEVAPEVSARFRWSRKRRAPLRCRSQCHSGRSGHRFPISRACTFQGRPRLAP
jgi:hypothetical protein